MAKKIRIYYRAPSHVPLWKVMEEGGFLSKHGLEMEMGSLEGQRKRAAEGLKAGDLDVVSGNHHNLYARKALYGDPYVHIAQSNNSWRENFLGLRQRRQRPARSQGQKSGDGRLRRPHRSQRLALPAPAWFGRRTRCRTGENGKKGTERAREVDGRKIRRQLHPRRGSTARAKVRRQDHRAAVDGDDRRRDADDDHHLRAES